LNMCDCVYWTVSDGLTQHNIVTYILLLGSLWTLLLWRYRISDAKMTTDLHLVLRFRMSGGLTPLPRTMLWRKKGKVNPSE
jgi:hypothetical protein